VPLSVSSRFRSISKEVADTLRDMILVGSLPPGTQITQEEIATRLGVSTMPVREALIRLSHEGLIVARRGRSYRVRRITRSDVDDVFWLHATVERELTRRACYRAGEVAGQLEASMEVWKDAVRSGQTVELDDLNFVFHRLINQAAGAPALIRQLRHTLRTIPQHFYSLLPDWVEIATGGHQRILQAFKVGDADMAGTAAAEHVLEAGALLTHYFDDTGFWTPPPTRSSD
jgi:DNA-binding GntR family transcriptional regulator